MSSSPVTATSNGRNGWKMCSSSRNVFERNNKKSVLKRSKSKKNIYPVIYKQKMITWWHIWLKTFKWCHRTNSIHPICLQVSKTCWEISKIWHSWLRTNHKHPVLTTEFRIVNKVKTHFHSRHLTSNSRVRIWSRICLSVITNYRTETSKSLRAMANRYGWNKTPITITIKKTKPTND